MSDGPTLPHVPDEAIAAVLTLVLAAGGHMNDDLKRQLADHAAQIAALRRDLAATKEMLERLIARLQRGE
jgi:hypothetical protein